MSVLAKAIVATGSVHAHALHQCFSSPALVTDKAVLQHSLKLWRADFEELRESTCVPSKATALQSLRTLISGIDELKIPLEVLEMTQPDNLGAIYRLVDKKAADWAILASDFRSSSLSVVPKATANIATTSSGTLRRICCTASRNHSGTFCGDEGSCR